MKNLHTFESFIYEAFLNESSNDVVTINLTMPVNSSGDIDSSKKQALAKNGVTYFIDTQNDAFKHRGREKLWGVELKGTEAQLRNAFKDLGYRNFDQNVAHTMRDLDGKLIKR